MKAVLSQEVLRYLENSVEETLKLIEQIAVIPAPSGQEDARARFCESWLKEAGADTVEIDDAKNLLYFYGCEGKKDWILFSAHTDVVFPDNAPLSFSRDAHCLRAPGVGDDTACLAVLLMIAKYVARHRPTSPYGILFAANSCEEGLGNLKGIRRIMEKYGYRIRRAYTLDGQFDAVVSKCVGSCRYEVTVETEGGHSFNDFGNRNAICSAARLITWLEDCSIPSHCVGKTTFNVGRMEGGTSVNTVAQRACFLYEFRSDEETDLERMRVFFEDRIRQAREAGLGEITVRTVGIRPCGGRVDETVLNEMLREALEISEECSGLPCRATSGSTDCNIPMSMGIPALCVGSYLGGGQHTREEWIRADSISVGLRIAARLILGYFCDEED